VASVAARHCGSGTDTPPAAAPDDATDPGPAADGAEAAGIDADGADTDGAATGEANADPAEAKGADAAGAEAFGGPDGSVRPTGPGLTRPAELVAGPAPVAGGAAQADRGSTATTATASADRNRFAPVRLAGRRSK